MAGDPNNNYECECARCGEHFRGNKRAIICPKCKLVAQAQELDMGYGPSPVFTGPDKNIGAPHWGKTTQGEN